MLITFEGPEGGGKTSQVARLGAELRARGLDPLLTREPGGTALGERLRGLLLDLSGSPMPPGAEALLFCAARQALVEQHIRPALAEGRVVLCDRFADATRAYQGHGRGLPMAGLEAIIAFATGGLAPDLTLLLDLPVERGLARRRGAADWNRFDAGDLAFHERVRAGYLALAAAEPARWRRIDADRSEEAVARSIRDAVLDRLALAAGPGGGHG